jgi:hypothetical protein
MGLVAYAICSRGDWTTVGRGGEKVLLLSLGILSGVGAYLICSHMMRNEEMGFLLKMIRRKR